MLRIHQGYTNLCLQRQWRHMPVPACSPTAKAVPGGSWHLVLIRPPPARGLDWPLASGASALRCGWMERGQCTALHCLLKPMQDNGARPGWIVFTQLQLNLIQPPAVQSFVFSLAATGVLQLQALSLNSWLQLPHATNLHMQRTPCCSPTGTCATQQQPLYTTQGMTGGTPPSVGP